jgi:hypothetical protein
VVAGGPEAFAAERQIVEESAERHLNARRARSLAGIRLLADEAMATGPMAPGAIKGFGDAADGQANVTRADPRRAGRRTVRMRCTAEARKWIVDELAVEASPRK